VPGRFDAACAQEDLPRRIPSAIRNGRAGQMDQGVRTFSRHGVEFAANRIPSDGLRPSAVRVPFPGIRPHQAQNRVPLPFEHIDQ